MRRLAVVNGLGRHVAPYSESQFKTLKYCPQFPDRFGALEDARSFGQIFFPWYNTEHRHSGIGCTGSPSAAT